MTARVVVPEPGWRALLPVVVLVAAVALVVVARKVRRWEERGGLRGKGAT